MREYPTAFRSPLGPMTAPVPTEATLRVRCHCGACTLALTVNTQVARAVRCHCVKCRRYHTSAFGAFLKLPGEASRLATIGTAARGYDDSCEAAGKVERVFCGSCYSVLASIPEAGAAADQHVLLALGCVEDDSVPPALAQHWAGCFEEWALPQRALWWEALPRRWSRAGGQPSRTIRGGCACGSCTFEARSGDEASAPPAVSRMPVVDFLVTATHPVAQFQTQHCYCNLCRRLSGSVAQTWVRGAQAHFIVSCAYLSD